MDRRNPNFNPHVKSEQLMYENIIIESLRIFGQEVYYLPREWQNKDDILGDDPVSKFNKAYQLLMYIENADGFEGERDLFTKFGVELRDEATFVCARRSWLKEVGTTETDISFYRPREGDLIYLKLSGSLFEILKVEDETPFYQLQNLPVFRMRCQLFENNGEDFDTGIEGLDTAIETTNTYSQDIIVNVESGNEFYVGEIVEQVIDSDEGNYMRGEVLSWDASINTLRLIHVGSSIGEYAEFEIGQTIEGSVSGTIATVGSIDENLGTEGTSQNEDFKEAGLDFIDFSETNPFGDV